MLSYSAPELVMIISALSAMGVALLTAWRLGTRVAQVDTKLESVHEVTNKNFALQRDEIATLRLENAALRAAAQNSEMVRALLAAEVARAVEAVRLRDMK